MSIDTLLLPPDPPILLGRDADLQPIKEWVRNRQDRAHTVFGSHGSGITSLLRRAAHQLTRDFPDGIYFCEPGLGGSLHGLADSLAEALGLCLDSPEEALEQCAYFLKTRRCLLVLDMDERLDGLGSGLAKLMAGAPMAKALVGFDMELEFGSSQELKTLGPDLSGQVLAEWGKVYKSPPLSAGDHEAMAMRCKGLPSLLRLAAGASDSKVWLDAEGQGAPWARQALKAELGQAHFQNLADLCALRGEAQAKLAEEVGACSLSDLEVLRVRGLLEFGENTGYRVPRWISRVLGTPAEEALTQHALSFAVKVERLEAGLRSGLQRRSANQMSMAAPDILAAWVRSCRRADTQRVREMAPALSGWLSLRGRHRQAQNVLSEAVSSACGERVRMMARWMQAWAAFRHRPGREEAQRLTEAAREAEQEGGAELAPQAAQALAAAYCALGELGAAREAALRAQDAFRRQNDEIGQAWCNYRLGAIEAAGQRNADAAGQWRMALEAFQNLSCDDGQAWTQARLGALYENQGLLREARLHLEAAVAFFEKFGRKYYAARSLARLIHVLRAQNEEESSQEACRKGLTLLRDARWDEGEGWMRFYLADVAATRHQDVEAKEQAKEALRLFKKSNQRDGVAWAFVILTMLAARAGDGVECGRMAREGEATFVALGGVEGQAACLRWLGLASEKAGKLEQAAQHWRRAADLAMQSKVRWRFIELAGELARIAEAAKQWERAAQLYGLAAFDSASPRDAKAMAGEGLNRMRKSWDSEKVHEASRSLLKQPLEQVLASFS